MFANISWMKNITQYRPSLVMVDSGRFLAKTITGLGLRDCDIVLLQTLLLLYLLVNTITITK